MDFHKLLATARQDAGRLRSGALLPEIPAKSHKLFNLLMNFRLKRTPHRRILFVDLRSPSEFASRHISGFANIPDVNAVNLLMQSLAQESQKFSVFAVGGYQVSELFRSRIDLINLFGAVNLDEFLGEFPFLAESANSTDAARSLASAAYPTFAAEEVLYSSVFSFNSATISALRISKLVDMTPNGFSETSVITTRCSDTAAAAASLSEALKEGRRVLVVDAEDGHFAALAATAAVALHYGLDATSAASRVMAKTDLGFNPSSEDVQKLSKALMKQNVATLQEPALPFPLRSSPGILTRIKLPAPRTNTAFAEDSLDALQELVVFKGENLSLEEREAAVEKLGLVLATKDVSTDRDALRQASALLSFIIDEWPEEVELSEEITQRVKSIAAFCFEHEPTEFHGEVRYSEKDGFPASLTDCMRALVLALQLVL